MGLNFVSFRSILAFIALSLVGCGTDFLPAEGTVTLDGVPLVNATVVFQAPDRPLATAKTDSQGHFRVETGSIQGIRPGEYRVAVNAYRDFSGGDESMSLELAVPNKYVQPDSSGLKAIIADGESSNINFALITDIQTSQ